ncbi:hypothetical protein scyTo_0004630 [Scyliorhinus torazame]|uniref:Uncharacterized protein n=1 Tax=Scyliorhinus torazame TaxID=75743 RepID=A0A401NUP7_SCYTO|nr:hypothetical protein [Scyliorhinus torazame]
MLKRNHFAQQCQSMERTQVPRSINYINEMSHDASTLQNAVRSRQNEDTSATGGDEDSFFIDTIVEDTERFYEIKEMGTGQVDNWITQLMINQTSTFIKMDTGARVNLINEADLKKMCIQPDNECSLTDNQDARIKTHGK